MQRIRVISVLLVFVLLMQIFPAGVVAAPDAPEVMATANTENGEVTELRDAHTKVFRNKQGLEYRVHAKLVHYQDADGKWQEMKPEIKAKCCGNHGFESNSLPFAAEFSEAGLNQVSFRYRDGVVKFKIPDEIGTGVFDTEQKGATLKYRRAGREVEYRYDLLGNGLKETIVLNKPTDKNRYSFEVEFEGANPVPQPDGGIAAVNEAGEVLWSIAPPTAVDAAGVPAQSIAQELEQRDGKTYLTITVDAGWLTDKRRKWPVEIDPTMTIAPDAGDGMDTTLESYTDPEDGFWETSYPHGATLYADHNQISLLKFPLHAIPRGATISSAQLMVFGITETSGTSYDAPTSIYPVLVEWEERNAKWSQVFGYDGPLNDLGPVLATQQVKSSAWTSFTVTSQMNQWVAGERPNYGFALRSTSGRIGVASSDIADLTFVPYLSIQVVRDSQTPEVSISTPSDTVPANQGPSITLQVRDDVGVTRADAFVDGRQVGHWEGFLSASSNYQALTWDSLPGVQPGPHTLKAVVEDGAGNRATVSKSFTTEGAPVPSSLVALGTGGSRVQLSWSPLLGQTYTYQVSRSTDPGFGINVFEVPVSTNSYEDTGVTDGTVYYYRVRAVPAVGLVGAYSRAALAVAAPGPTEMLAYTGSWLDSTAALPSVSEATYPPRFSPSPDSPAWDLGAAGFAELARQDDVKLSAQTAEAGLIRGHLHLFDLLGSVNRHRINQGMGPVELDDLRTLGAGITVKWTGFGAGANGTSAGTGVRIRLWNRIKQQYDLEQQHTGATGSTLTVQVPEASFGEYVDGSGRIVALVEPTWAASSTIPSVVSSDHVQLTATFRTEAPTEPTAAPIGNGEVQVVWKPFAFGYYVHRSTVSSFTPDANNRISPLLGSASFIDSATNGLEPSTAYYYKVVSALSGASSVATPAVNVSANAPLWIAVGQTYEVIDGEDSWTVKNGAEYTCSTSNTYNPNLTGTQYDTTGYTAIVRRDGKAANNGCTSTSQPIQAFQFWVSNAVGQTRYTSVASAISAVTLDWTGYGTNGNTAKPEVLAFNPTTLAWEVVGRAVYGTQAEQSLLQIPTPSKYLASDGSMWLAVRNPLGSQTNTLYTDYIRLGVMMTGATAKPTAPTATVTSDGYVTLTIAGSDLYHVYRSTNKGTTTTPNWSAYVRISGPVTKSYTDRTAGNGQGQRYIVRAVDPVTGEGTPSNPSSTVTISGTAPLAAPGSVQITAEPEKVSLQWAAVIGSSGYRLYRVQRTEASGLWYQPVATALAGDTAYSLPASNSAYYVVTTLQADGRESAPGGEVTPMTGFGRYHPDHPLVEYTGTWTRTDDIASLRADLHLSDTATAGSKAAMTIRAAGRIRVVAAKGPHYGIMQIYRNGALAGEADLYDSNSKPQQEVFWLNTIAVGDRIEVRQAGRKNASSTSIQIDLDALEFVPAGMPWLLEADPKQGRIDLQWVGAPEAARGYTVFRSTSLTGLYTALDPVPVTVTSYSDTTVAEGTTYYYVVQGVKSDSSLTPASNNAAAGALAAAGRVGLDNRWPYVSVPMAGANGYVDLQSGNLVLPVTDAVVPFNRTAVVLRRTYNSGTQAHLGVGKGWRLNAHQRIDEVTYGSDTVVSWTDGDGSQTRFTLQGGQYLAEPQTLLTLRKLAGGWEVERKDGTIYSFRADGWLSSVSDRYGNAIQYSIDAAGRVTQITPRAASGYTGTSLMLTYTENQLSQVMDGAGREYLYGYDESGRLNTSTDPSGVVITYSYDQSDRLIKVQDREGRSTSIGYQNGSVASYRDGVGATTQFTYAAGQTTLTNPLSQPLVFQINAQGRLAGTIDALNNKTTLTYDADLNLVELRDSLGRMTVLSQYDQWGNPGSIRDPLGKVTTMTYHPTLHTLEEMVDPLGRVSRTAYNDQGDPQVITAAVGTPDEQVTIRTYDVNGLLTGVIDPRGKITSYAYDSNGWVTSITDPLGAVSAMSYDLAGNLIEQKDPIGRITTFEYDGSGRRTRTVQAGQIATVAQYDRAGYLMRQVDPAGAEVTYVYDAAGRVVAQTDPLGGTVRYEYDSAGRPTAVTDPKGNRSLKAYDAAGRPVAETDPEGGQTYMEYDSVGNVVRVTLPNGYVMATEYDSLDRPVRVNQPPATVEYIYDAAGNKILDRDGNGRWTRFGYDNLNRLVQVWDALNVDQVTRQPKTDAKSTQYRYDAAGNRTAVIDARGKTTSFEYDAMNRLVREVNPVLDAQQYLYDVAGQMTESINGNGALRTYTYDLRGNVIKVENDESCDNIRYEYDQVGRKVAVQNELGTVRYQYDLAGRLLQETDPYGNATAYRYDPNGNMISMSMREGTWQYTYDRANRVSTVTDPGGLLTRYTRTPDGRPLRVELPYGVTLQHAYDSKTNRLVSQTYAKQDGTVGAEFSYQYDTKGNLVAYGGPRPGYSNGASYVYDELDRIKHSGGLQYEYDEVGNMIKKGTKKYEYDDANRIRQVIDGTTVTERYVYDPAGRLTLVGGVSNSTNIRYEYDGFDQLIRVTDGPGVTTYGYDGEGRRMYRKYFNRDEVASTTGRTNQTFKSDSVYFQYGAGKVMAERDGTGVALSYVTRGAGGQLLTLHSRDVNTAVMSTFIFVTDRLGTVHQVVDKTFTVKNQYGYSAFGEVTSTTESVTNDWKFAGERLDASSGLYHLSARYYNPGDGRFLTQDTYKGNPWEPWTQNLYVYVHNNPVNFTDPTGHRECEGAGENCEDDPLPNSVTDSGSATEDDSALPEVTKEQCEARHGKGNCGELMPGLYVHIPKKAGIIITPGTLFETSFVSGGQTIGVLAETSAEGTTLTLDAVTIYAKGSEAANVVGARAFLQFKELVVQAAKNQGFQNLVINAVRAANSTSANPGKIIQIMIDLTK